MLTKTRAEHEGSTMEEELLLEEKPDEMPDVYKRPAGVEFDDTVVSNCEETTVEVSKVRDAARDIKA